MSVAFHDHMARTRPPLLQAPEIIESVTAGVLVRGMKEQGEVPHR